MMWAKLKGILNMKGQEHSGPLAGTAVAALGQIAEAGIKGYLCLMDTHAKHMLRYSSQLLNSPTALLAE
jgi:hypothetical protein